MDADIKDLIILVFFVSLYIFTEIRNYVERKNLTDRLMAKDFDSFNNAELDKMRASKRPIVKAKGIEL